MHAHWDIALHTHRAEVYWGATMVNSSAVMYCSSGHAKVKRLGLKPVQNCCKIHWRNIHSQSKLCLFSDLKMTSFAPVQSDYIIAIFRWSGKLVEIWGRSSWACVVRGNVTAVYIDLIQTIQYIKWKAKTYKHEVWTYQQPCSKGIRLWEGQFSWVLLLASVKSTGKHSSCFGQWARCITSFILAVGCW